MPDRFFRDPADLGIVHRPYSFASNSLHNRRTRCLLQFVVVLAAFLIAGCGGGGLRTVDFSDRPIQSASPEALVERVNRDAAALHGLKGKLNMGLKRAQDEEARRCSGVIIATRSPRIGLYLKGYKRLIPTFFTLVSDGDAFWFHIPRDDIVYTGPLDFVWSRGDSLGLHMNARDLLRALFVAPVDAGASWSVEDEVAFYVITIYDRGFVSRKIWIERRGFHAVREMYYNRDGIEQLEIQRTSYADLDGRVYPASLTIHDVMTGSSIYMDFNEITLDPENVPGEAFRFRIPKGVDVKRVDTDEAQT